jgi:hypothetical protein
LTATALLALITRNPVNQASNSSQALDAAVSTAELLISSYNGYGDRPARGHKHALQSIRLLASIPKRFDTAIDLFFDLVERSCAHSHGQGKFYSATAGRSSVNTTCMMQNYDQILAKLISRQWSKGNGFIRWNVQAPIDRIKNLRQIYDHGDAMSIRSVRTFSRRRQYTSTAIFSESERILHKIRKASTELVWAVWARNIKAQLRSWSKKKEPFDPTLTTASTASTFSEVESISPVSMDARRKFTPRDAEAADTRHQVDVVYAILEEQPHTKCKQILCWPIDTQLTD